MRTNSSHAIYTCDSTGGGPDYIVVNARFGATAYVLPALSGTRELLFKDTSGTIQNATLGLFLVPAANETFDTLTPYALAGTSYHFTNGSGSVTASGSLFTSELQVGESIQSSNQSGVNYVVTAIATDGALTISPTFGGTTTTTATATRTSLDYNVNFGALGLFSDGTNWYTC